MTIHIWCDQCGDWVDSVYINGQEILCLMCDNRLLINLPKIDEQKIRIQIAKAMWGL